MAKFRNYIRTKILGAFYSFVSWSSYISKCTSPFVIMAEYHLRYLNHINKFEMRVLPSRAVTIIKSTGPAMLL